jgi:hypothetical protein
MNRNQELRRRTGDPQAEIELPFVENLQGLFYAYQSFRMKRNNIWSKPYRQPISVTYCPFCGQKYDE